MRDSIPQHMKDRVPSGVFCFATLLPVRRYHRVDVPDISSEPLAYDTWHNTVVRECGFRYQSGSYMLCDEYAVKLGLLW